MIIISTAQDIEAGLEKLVQAMLSIERGTADCLTISVPGETTGAPSILVSHKPVTAVVYYVPNDYHPQLLAEQVEWRLAKHGREHFSLARLAAVTHSASFFQAPTNEDRVINIVDPYDADGSCTNSIVPASSTSAFTWYFVPVGVACHITRVRNVCEFNALVASILFCTTPPKLMTSEIEKPVFNLSPTSFGIRVIPDNKLWKLLSERPLRFIYLKGRLIYVPTRVACLLSSSPPAPIETVSPQEAGAILGEGWDEWKTITSDTCTYPDFTKINCFRCGSGLWGVISVNNHFNSFCYWCSWSNVKRGEDTGALWVDTGIEQAEVLKYWRGSSHDIKRAYYFIEATVTRHVVSTDHENIRIIYTARLKNGCVVAIIPSFERRTRRHPALSLLYSDLKDFPYMFVNHEVKFIDE